MTPQILTCCSRNTLIINVILYHNESNFSYHDGRKSRQSLKEGQVYNDTKNNTHKDKQNMIFWYFDFFHCFVIDNFVYSVYF